MAETIRLESIDRPVTLRRSARARRITLTAPHDGGPPRLTAPPQASLSEIRMFLLRQEDWLRDALARAPQPVEVRPGARLPVAGRMRLVMTMPGARRPPALDGDRLVLQGGDPTAAGPRIEAWLKERARAELTAIARACAAELGASPGRITLRDTRGRWGSCASSGNLSFSWRLAMAPPETLDYVAAHEAAHLLEMNHGPRFWELVERLRPGWRRQRDWLRREGPGLMLYRFGAAR